MSFFHLSLIQQIRDRLAIPSPPPDENLLEATLGETSRLFRQSIFWLYTPPGTYNHGWRYCFSRLQDYDQVLSKIFIGGIAAVQRLCVKDFKINEKQLGLEPKDGTEEEWAKIKEKYLPVPKPTAFQHVISVVKNAAGEAVLREIIQKAATPSLYSEHVKTHTYVHLSDLPQTPEEKDLQAKLWADFQAKNLSSILQVIDTAVEKEEAILIHCTAGRHRSVAILTAWMVLRLRLSVPEAITYIQKKRRCAVGVELSEFTPFLVELARSQGIASPHNEIGCLKGLSDI